MNKVATKQFESIFQEFYKDGMDLTGANGFDLFDEFALFRGFTLNKTPVVDLGGDTPIERLYGSNALDELLDEINRLKENSNFAFTKSYIATGVQFVMHKCTDILEKEYRKPDLKYLVSEQFGNAALVAT